MSEPLFPDVNLPVETPLQFGIRDMLIAQAVCALGLGLLALAGIFAVMAIFVATLVLCFVAGPVAPGSVRLKRFLVDLMGGIVLPGLCIVYGPARWFDLAPAAAAIGLLTIAVQMLALFVWLVFRSRLGRGSAVFAGVLLVGAVISGVVGTVLLPVSLVMLAFYGIGLLGFIPLLTCYAFLGNAYVAMRYARAVAGKRTAWFLFFAGIMLAGAVPATIYLAAGPWIEHAVKAIPWPKDWWDRFPLR